MPVTNIDIMSEQSLKAYASMSSGQLETQEQRVLNEIHRGGVMGRTREQIAQNLEGIKESAVCGRVNALLKKQKCCEIGTRKTASGKDAAVLIHINFLNRE